MAKFDPWLPPARPITRRPFASHGAMQASDLQNPERLAARAWHSAGLRVMSSTTDLILARSRPRRLDPVMQRFRWRGMARGFAQQADQRIGMDQECARHGVGR